MNDKEILALCTERARGEEMLCILLNVQVVEYKAIITPFNLVVFPFKKVPRIYSVSKHQSYKKNSFFVTLVFQIHLKGSGASIDLKISE
jgi:hypothetical protein